MISCKLFCCHVPRRPVLGKDSPSAFKDSHPLRRAHYQPYLLSPWLRASISLLPRTSHGPWTSRPPSEHLTYFSRLLMMRTRLVSIFAKVSEVDSLRIRESHTCLSRSIIHLSYVTCNRKTLVRLHGSSTGREGFHRGGISSGKAISRQLTGHSRVKAFVANIGYRAAR